MKPDLPLAGRRLLVVEDDYFVAVTLADMLASRGASIAGPVANLGDASTLLADSADLDCALLDINLRGVYSYGLLESLADRGIPCVFVTSYDHGYVPPEYASIPYLQKPLSSDNLVTTLLKLCA